MRDLDAINIHYRGLRIDAKGRPAVIAAVVASLTIAGVIAFLVWRWYG